MSAFGSTKQVLEKARAFSKGQGAEAVVRETTLQGIDVAKIRAQTGLSQTDFARSFGVAKGTLLNWKQGRLSPQGPAQVLLALIARKPSVVQELLGHKGSDDVTVPNGIDVPRWVCSRAQKDDLSHGKAERQPSGHRARGSRGGSESNSPY